MDEVLPAILVVLCASVGVFTMSINLPKLESFYLRLSFAAHLLSSVTLLYAMDYVFLESDVHFYITQGRLLAGLMRRNLWTWTPEVLRLTLGMHHALPLEIFGEGSATASMTGITGFGMFVGADSQYAVNLLFGTMSFFGKWALYRGLDGGLRLPASRRPLLIATTMIPSVVFWTSGIVKESFAVMGLGLATLALSGLLRRISVGRVALLALGLGILFLFKPYLLFPFVIAAGAWYFVQRSARNTAAPKPVYLLLAAGAAIGAVAALGAIVPQFSVERLGESTAHMQYYGALARGGSNYSLGFEPTNSLRDQLLFAPLALITTLARPFLFEAHNFSALIAASEVTVLFVLLGRGVFKNPLGSLWYRITSSPVLSFSASFTLLAGTAIGLATTNFGTLSRYRVPMMPFYILVVLMLNVRQSMWKTGQKDDVPPTQPTRTRPALAAPTIRVAPRSRG